MIETPVQSSTIQRVSYDPKAEKLRIQFRSGGEYEYDEVDPIAYASLMNADSIGSHFQRVIRPHYVGRKMEPPQQEDEDVRAE